MKIEKILKTQKKKKKKKSLSIKFYAIKNDVIKYTSVLSKNMCQLAFDKKSWANVRQEN